MIQRGVTANFEPLASSTPIQPAAEIDEGRVDSTNQSPHLARNSLRKLSPIFDSDALLDTLPKGSPERKAVFGESEPDTPLSIEEAAARLRERRTKDADLVRYSDEARPRTDKQAAQDLDI